MKKKGEEERLREKKKMQLHPHRRREDRYVRVELAKLRVLQLGTGMKNSHNFGTGLCQQESCNTQIFAVKVKRSVCTCMYNCIQLHDPHWEEQCTYSNHTMCICNGNQY